MLPHMDHMATQIIDFVMKLVQKNEQCWPKNWKNDQIFEVAKLMNVLSLILWD